MRGRTSSDGASAYCSDEQLLAALRGCQGVLRKASRGKRAHGTFREKLAAGAAFLLGDGGAPWATRRNGAWDQPGAFSGEQRDRARRTHALAGLGVRLPLGCSST